MKDIDGSFTTHESKGKLLRHGKKMNARPPESNNLSSIHLFSQIYGRLPPGIFYLLTLCNELLPILNLYSDRLI